MPSIIQTLNSALVANLIGYLYGVIIGLKLHEDPFTNPFISLLKAFWTGILSVIWVDLFRYFVPKQITMIIPIFLSIAIGHHLYLLMYYPTLVPTYVLDTEILIIISLVLVILFLSLAVIS